MAPFDRIPPKMNSSAVQMVSCCQFYLPFGQFQAPECPVDARKWTVTTPSTELRRLILLYFLPFQVENRLDFFASGHRAAQRVRFWGASGCQNAGI
jgi:hypothetical protein